MESRRDNRRQRAHRAITASETSATRECSLSHEAYYVNPFDLEVLTDNDLEKSMGGKRNLMQSTSILEWTILVLLVFGS